MVLEYAGDAFHGFQAQRRQERLPTVQETVEKAIGELTGERVRVTGAGRTDAGVHALGQVIGFSTRARIPSERWPAALNSKLPPEVRAWQAFRVAPGFDARRHARRKLYRYRFYLSPVVSAMASRQAVAVRPPLDVQAMIRAASLFEGEHDLRAFCGAAGAERIARREQSLEQGDGGRGFRRRIYRCRLLPDGVGGMWPGWSKGSSRVLSQSVIGAGMPLRLWPPGFMEVTGEERGSQAGEMLYALTPLGRVPLLPQDRQETDGTVDAYCDAHNAPAQAGCAWSLWVEADGFLYHQIRTMVGTLWEIGRGERSIDSLMQLLEGKDRSEAGPTAPAHGLYLVAVAYPGWSLGIQGCE
ncbi:MAG: tRNA pseudouridine synthase A [Limnochordales bacterium]|nr:tRNA pseudouridine synthase A [Limnochordales bacterium]